MLNITLCIYQAPLPVDRKVSEIVHGKIRKAHPMKLDSGQLALGDLALAAFQKTLRHGRLGETWWIQNRAFHSGYA